MKTSSFHQASLAVPGHRLDGAPCGRPSRMCVRSPARVRDTRRASSRRWRPCREGTPTRSRLADALRLKYHSPAVPSSRFRGRSHRRCSPRNPRRCGWPRPRRSTGQWLRSWHRRLGGSRMGSRAGSSSSTTRRSTRRRMESPKRVGVTDDSAIADRRITRASSAMDLPFLAARTRRRALTSGSKSRTVSQSRPSSWVLQHMGWISRPDLLISVPGHCG